MPLRKQQLSEGHICGKLPLPIFGESAAVYLGCSGGEVRLKLTVSHLRQGAAANLRGHTAVY